jgi:hypothetical protein
VARRLGQALVGRGSLAAMRWRELLHCHLNSVSPSPDFLVAAFDPFLPLAARELTLIC